MKNIAIFFHGLTCMGNPPTMVPAALEIIHGQFHAMHQVGLLENCSHLQVGINGGEESRDLARIVIPSSAKIVLHGLDCHTENKSLMMVEDWVPSHPNWYVLYLHAKGCTHPLGDSFRTIWRNCMMRHCVYNWRQCVADLDSGYDSVGVHWMTYPATPLGQSIWAGNFWWATSNFLATLPSITKRDRIKMSGIGAVESRYESEVWIGNGPRLPKVRDYHCPPGGWNPSKIATCTS